MPLIDSYIKCGNIKGGYKAVQKNTHTARQEAIHNDWSEIYTFRYEISDAYPTITFTKPIDDASNDLYTLYLRNRSRDIQHGKSKSDLLIDEISIELCRWVDKNEDGIVDEQIVFLEYILKQCRILNYSTGIDFDADDIPEETVTFGFRELIMNHYHPVEATSLRWDFMTAKEIAAKQSK